ncbi:hypothetical protein HF521_018376 [Silurus meridionalis]|uniref:C-type lectin domain-containing protein n=2 Tax=Silurus meridionalis TaxID=175797 RepID=A0A8T0BJE3_SILME|nr:hypothetical protein HF521_018376 [Silurus meridionalis]
MNWSDAHAYCQEFHTDLALANSTAENDRMQSIAYVQGRSWIGLYRDSWKWSDGTNTSNFMWLAGQPDNYYQNENCAVLNNGWFNDVKCNQLHYFICHTIILSFMQIFVHKYYLIKTNVTWQAAQNYCRETYDDLATVETDLDWLILKKELAAQGLNDVVWVGLYNDSDSWRWAFNDIPMKNTFSHWNTEQPDNLGGNQACCLSGPLGYWWDYTCTLLFPFICFNANISAAGRYVGVTSAMNWSDAHAYCQEFHTDLAVLSSTEENDRMQSIAYVQGRSWIGLYRDTWKWSDGTNTSSLMWLAGQPDNYYQNENCAVLNNGWFNDVKCHQLHYFICHTTHLLRKQQTVKLKVKSSDESVTDSDMQSAISELIKMKLDKNGMLENTTVTWRVQSDGQVFQK